MTVDAKIVEALNGIAPVYADNTDVDAQDMESEYMVFNYDVRPVFFGSNRTRARIYYVQIHYICPLRVDSIKKRKEIHRKLLQAGFTDPSITNASVGRLDIGFGANNRSGTGFQHYVYECEIEEGLRGP